MYYFLSTYAADESSGDGDWQWLSLERERCLEKTGLEDSLATALPSCSTTGLKVRVPALLPSDHHSSNHSHSSVRGRAKGSFIDRVALAVPAKPSSHQHDTHKGPRRDAAPRSSIALSRKKMKANEKPVMPRDCKSLDEYFKRKNFSK